MEPARKAVTLMDSMDFVKQVFWHPDREGSDAILESAVEWFACNAAPSRVFSEVKLGLWATQHGYVKQDVTELLALLRESQSVIPAHSILAVAISEALYKYGGRTVIT